MEIQRADLSYRRRVVRTVAAVAILLCITIVAFVFWLHHVSAKLDTAELVKMLHLMLSGCVALIALCLAALGAHLLLRGKLIVRERRFPPRDVRAVRDTPVREADAAVRIGRASQALGLLFILLALLAGAGGLLWVQRL